MQFVGKEKKENTLVITAIFLSFDFKYLNFTRKSDGETLNFREMTKHEKKDKKAQ